MVDFSRSINQFLTNLLKLTILGILNIFIGITRSQAQTIIQPEQLDCRHINSDTLVTTSEGMRDAPLFCQGLSDLNSAPNNSQQPPAAIEIKPRPPWEIPYILNGSICRDRGVDTVCLTPQGASSIRWSKRYKAR